MKNCQMEEFLDFVLYLQKAELEVMGEDRFQVK